MNILIKKARIDDLADVATLFDSYRVFYKRPSDQASALAFIEERLSLGESTIFIASDESGESIGFTQLYPSFSSQTMQRTWILNDLYVKEGFRKRGVASKLIRSAADHCESTSAKGLMLCTQHSNLKAQALYEKMGFEPDDDYRWYFLTVNQPGH